MSTKQSLTLIASMLIIALLASPCAAQVIYVRDAAGYVRPVVIPQPTAFGMSMQVQPVVSPDGMFVRMNFSQLSVSMPDPTATTFLTIPGPNLGIFRNGVRQPATIALKPNVIALGGQQSLFGQGGFGQGFSGQGFSASSFGGFGFGQGFSANSFGAFGLGNQAFVNNASAMFQPNGYAVMPAPCGRVSVNSRSSTAQADSLGVGAFVSQIDSWRTTGPSYADSTWIDSVGMMGPSPAGLAWTDSSGMMQSFTATR